MKKFEAFIRCFIDCPPPYILFPYHKKMSDIAHIFITVTSKYDQETGRSSAVEFPVIPEEYREFLDFKGPFGYMMNYHHEIGYQEPVRALFNVFYPIDLDKYDILFKRTGYPMTYEQVKEFEIKFLNFLRFLHRLGIDNNISFFVNAYTAK